VGHECCGAAAASSWSGCGWVSASRRTFFQYAAVVAGGFPFLPLPMVCRRRLNYKIERIDAAVANLPPNWTTEDCSAERHTYWRLHAAAEIARRDMANALSPDISFVTGDFVSSEAIRWRLHWRVEPAAAPLGFGMQWNHEIYAAWKMKRNGCFARMGCGCCARGVWWSITAGDLICWASTISGTA